MSAVIHDKALFDRQGVSAPPLRRSRETVLPFVSIIIPSRNEETHIAECLSSILANDYPSDRFEILVMDGMSEDGTRKIVSGFAEQYSCVKLLDNPERTIPAAMNAGIQHARGETIIKMDGHSTYQPDHISLCIAYQEHYGAGNVGGVCKMIAGADTDVARAIVLALGHRFGSGNAGVKVGASKPMWSDTAAFGCFKKEIFSRVGLFDERLASSSDIEMNYRIRRAGEGILLVPDIVINYRSDATLADFWRHNFADGVWATYVLKFRTKAWSWRHWVPLAFVLAVLGSLFVAALHPSLWPLTASILGMYLLASHSVTLPVAIRERKLKPLLILPLVFAIRHVAHGLGALLGLVLVVTPGTNWKGRRGAKV